MPVQKVRKLIEGTAYAGVYAGMSITLVDFVRNFVFMQVYIVNKLFMMCSICSCYPIISYTK